MTTVTNPPTDTKRFYHNFINKSTDKGMDINSVRLNIPDDISELLKRLEYSGHEAYIVGGAVRDGIMGRECNDYDITTSADPYQIKQVFSHMRTVDTGIKHGTVTVLTGSHSVEVTVFRCEGSYSDGRHPDSVTFSKSIKEDLQRRDFTINAIAYSPQRGFVDLYGGICDIEKRIVRCVGDPEKRFAEDKLRILRAVRFSSVLDFDIARETSSAIKKMATEISVVSKERIFSELCKLLCGTRAKQCLSEYRELLFAVIPELKIQDGYDQNNPNHCHTLFEHTLNVLDNAEADPTIRFAALLHDTGKPESMTTDKKGISHFYGHPELSENTARKVLRDLKASSEFSKQVCTLVKYHDVRFTEKGSAVKKYLGLLGSEMFFRLLRLQMADVKGQAPECIFRLENLNRVAEHAERIIESGEALTVKDLKINGNDLINAGIKPGKAVGKTLEHLLKQVQENKIFNEKDILIQEALCFWGK